MSKRPKYLVWTKDETGWTETADRPMTEREAAKRAAWLRSECRIDAKALPQGKKPEAA